MLVLLNVQFAQTHRYSLPVQDSNIHTCSLMEVPRRAVKKKHCCRIFNSKRSHPTQPQLQVSGHLACINPLTEKCALKSLIKLKYNKIEDPMFFSCSYHCWDWEQKETLQETQNGAPFSLAAAGAPQRFLLLLLKTTKMFVVSSPCHRHLARVV